MQTALIIGVVLACAFGLSRWHTRWWVERDRAVLFANVTSAFRFLETEYGLRPGKMLYDEKAFGNVIVEYARADLWFELVRDRSQWFFSIGPSAAKTLTMSQALPRCGAGADLDRLIADQWRSLELVADVVRRNFPGLIKVVGNLGSGT